ncbi:MAG: hypothetical protein QOA16_00785 [Nitrososphaeraceae archaeon]|nr:hypothetical protein [Nitrososphaeraceae archaeon]MDW3615084.1 hypothetical protein [Nitrososphaeraceae archaeon]
MSGASICILFFLMSQITPDIDAKVTGENKTSNKIIMHIHSNLNVTVNGRLLIVPNGIGINSTSWNDHSLDKFGTEQNENHNIWHDNSSNVPTTLMNQVVQMWNQPNRNYILGKFLNIWVLPLEGSKVILFIDR